MRETKTFTIEGREKTFEVYELSIREWKKVLNTSNFEGKDLASFLQVFQTSMLPFGANVTPEELDDLTPTEVDVIWQNFQEVNKTFFGLSARLGIKAMIEQMRPALLGAFGSYVVDWLKRATSEPQITATPTSLTPSTSTSGSGSKGSPTLPGRSKSEVMATKKSGSSS